MTDRRVYFLGLIAATLTLAACGGGGSSGTLPSSGSGSGSGSGGTIPGPPSSGGSSQAATVSFGSVSKQPFSTGEKRLLAPREANYGGTFTVTSSNPAVLSAAPRSGAGPFTLTGIAPGTAVITAADTSGHSGTLAFTVSATAAAPGASAAPIATGAPGTPPVPVPTPTAIVLPIPVVPVPGQPAQPTATPVAVTVPVGALGILSGTGANVSATVANPALATAVSLGNGMLAIVGAAPGATLVNVTSSAGTTAAAVTIPATPPLITVPNSSLSLSLLNTLGANVSVVSAGETGYTGGFTASVQNTGVAVVAPIPLSNNQFLVASVGPGSTFLTVQDSLGNTRYIAINVP